VSLAGTMAGWLVSGALLVLLLRLRRRLELAARACHELRGPATALGLAVAALAREPGGRRRVLGLEAQLDRLRAGLEDLEAARAGRRAPARPAHVPIDRLLRGSAEGWRPSATAAGRSIELHSELGGAVVRADHGRLAQALGNLLANAVEHGSGTVRLLGRRNADGVRVEVRDEGPAVRVRRRGHGLGIATDAVEDAGGRLTVERRADGTVAALELPAIES
jgi:signal transduction histidine kinase